MHLHKEVATVLTVYGIETQFKCKGANIGSFKLQQYLPFTVLKLFFAKLDIDFHCYFVATVLTVYGIETRQITYN